MNLAVLITCFNRRETTLRCLGTLFGAQLPTGWELQVYLVDDGSEDGTSTAVANNYPKVHILKGTGSLFWCGGMRMAWAAAEKKHPDGYLWLNDDVVMHPTALQAFHKAYHDDPKAIWIASCKDYESGLHTYGGRIRKGCHPGNSIALPPHEELPIRCDTFQGNLVFVSKEVVAKIGGMTDFQHAMADTDYGLRATKRGISCMLLPGYSAFCAANPQDGSHLDRNLSKFSRLKKMTGLKGLPPRDWWKFCSNHGGMFAPLYFLSPYLKVLLK